jgi:hypothetical protein
MDVNEVSWRSSVREASGKERQHLHATAPSGKIAARIHLVALYSAFAVIAAVVFGTFSVHPF